MGAFCKGPELSNVPTSLKPQVLQFLHLEHFGMHSPQEPPSSPPASGKQGSLLPVWRSVEYVGHILTGQGITKGTKVNDVMQMPALGNGPGLPIFLGSVQF